MVSVIVPIYNRAKTIEICVRSILNAGYENLEIILVDDGSTDDSLAKCQAFALKDSRILVYHQKNSGVSAARNTGINNSHGDWVAFVDSDDALAVGHFDLLEFADKKSVDLIQVMHASAICDGESVSSILLDSNPIKETVLTSNKDVLDFIFCRNDPYKNKFFYCHDKFFKRSILNQFNIRFPDTISLGEDQIFVCEYLRYTKSLLHSTRQTSLRLQWSKESRGYQLSSNQRGIEDYLFIIEKNYQALNNLFCQSQNMAVKAYAAYYLLCRPFSFFVVRHFSSWQEYRNNWETMKEGLRRSLPLMYIEKANIDLVQQWRVKLLCSSLFSIGICNTLVIAWIIRQYDYIKEGLKYRISHIRLCLV